MTLDPHAVLPGESRLLVLFLLRLSRFSPLAASPLARLERCWRGSPIALKPPLSSWGLLIGVLPGLRVPSHPFSCPLPWEGSGLPEEGSQSSTRLQNGPFVSSSFLALPLASGKPGARGWPVCENGPTTPHVFLEKGRIVGGEVRMYKLFPASS